MADKSSWIQEIRGIAHCPAIGRLARLFYRNERNVLRDLYSECHKYLPVMDIFQENE